MASGMLEDILKHTLRISLEIVVFHRLPTHGPNANQRRKARQRLR